MKFPRRDRFANALTRFVLLFVVQSLVLFGVVALCYEGMGKLRSGLTEVGDNLPKATVAAEVLHYSDVLRVIHVSLIGAATNDAYVEERVKRLKEVEDLLEKSLVQMESLRSWSPAERQIVNQVTAGMREYSKAFPPVLEQARKATPKELPDLIQANTAPRRDAYNMLLEMLPQLRNEAESVLDHNSRDFQRLQIAIVAGLAATLLLGLVTFRYVIVHNRRTREQADELNRSMQALSDGDLSTTCAVISSDELGRVAENLNQIFDLLARNIRTIVQLSTKLKSVVEVVSSRSRHVITSAADQGSRLDTAYFSIESLNGGIRKISLNVDSLAAASEQTSSSTLELVASMEEVARFTETLFGSVEETASSTTEMVTSIQEVDRNVDYLRSFTTDSSASMVEMSSSIGEVERNASRSRDLTSSVCEAAEAGMQAVRQTIAGMDEIRSLVHGTNDILTSLGERSSEIGRIVGVIDHVAQQTNLLALNAAILAAQAGNHGGGFSVVAEEIRDLSERTASSTKEIANVIRSVQSEIAKAVQSIRQGTGSVDRGVGLAGDAGRVLQDILESAKNSLDMSHQIAGAMKEQARSSDGVAGSVGRLQDMVRQISAATNQQNVGSSHIMKALEQMRDVTKAVRTATVDQKSGVVMISHAAEQMIDMVHQISGVVAAQTDDSGKIVKTMEQVRNLADGNRRSANEMNEAVALLGDALRELEEEVGKFKIQT